MKYLDEINAPAEVNLLVSFFDLTNYAKLSQTKSSQEMFSLLSDYFELTGEVIEKSGGRITKFIGDAGMAVFPEDKVNEGVRALMECRKRADSWFMEKGLPPRLMVKAHFGPVTCGRLGTKTNKILDVIGDTVNIAARMKTSGIAITPQVFRKLDDKNRKYFKKHTPPVLYIPVEESHKDF